MRRHYNADEGDDRRASLGDVYRRAIAADDTVLLQSLSAPRALRGRKADLVGELLSRQPPLALERAQDQAVGFIERHLALLFEARRDAKSDCTVFCRFRERSARLDPPVSPRDERRAGRPAKVTRRRLPWKPPAPPCISRLPTSSRSTSASGRSSRRTAFLKRASPPTG